MPDLLGWIEWALRRPGLTWMLAVVVVSTVLVGIAYGAWRLMGWLSDRIWRWRHPPVGSGGAHALGFERTRRIAQLGAAMTFEQIAHELGTPTDRIGLVKRNIELKGKVIVRGKALSVCAEEWHLLLKHDGDFSICTRESCIGIHKIMKLTEP